MTQIPDLLLGPSLDLVAESTFSPATLLPVLSSQWELWGLGQQNPKPGSVQVCRVREQPRCGALRLCRVSGLCTHRGWVWISADLHVTGGHRAFQLHREFWVQDIHVQSNPGLTWAADLPSWMRTECPPPLPLAHQFALGVAARVCRLWLQSLSTPGLQTRNAQTPHLPPQQAEYEECSCTDECCR